MPLFAFAGLSLMAGCMTSPATPLAPSEPLIIAHRGAPAELPEHTLTSYERAIEQGADYIEPDLVMTREGIFVARHENEISGTTDIADHPEFADRHTTKIIDGENISGWFTEDFTLAELRTLRARERLPELRPRSATYDGQYGIPTLVEIIELVQRQNRTVGIIPEIKHPGYFASIGLPMQQALADQLADAGYDSPDDPAMIQSFEIAPLVELNGLTDIRLVQLIGGSGAPADAPETSYASMIAPAGLRAIAAYADAIGPDKILVIPRTEANDLGTPTRLVADAHAAGLLVIPYTFRPENYFLPRAMQLDRDPREHGALGGEIAAYLAVGIDGLFTDFLPVVIEERGGPADNPEP